ncbi:hypothetical protein [Pseudomonas sp. Irchel s3a12]|uniref:hypothetical protein n=1 Tax=Pseudomonas sp. Irchel s3a12 TaxID=2009047 RepID=UPI000BA31055|nr:hypothetical protein [Pseudomonas sp. Irchel s3a12]
MYNQEVFKLEKYKYILARKQSLNEATFKITAIYQVAIAALGLAQYNVIAMLKADTITFEVASLSSLCLILMLTILTILIVALLIGGILAWLKYRRDESEIEQEVFGKPRSPVKLTSIFTWYETYIAITVALVFSLWLWTYFERLIPLLCLFAEK